jgi:hypothetical protein
MKEEGNRGREKGRELRGESGKAEIEAGQKSETALCGHAPEKTPPPPTAEGSFPLST